MSIVLIQSLNLKDAIWIPYNFFLCRVKHPVLLILDSVTSFANLQQNTQL